MNTHKRKVVFIMSEGHSGSSLTALMLGSHPDCFSTGELKGLPPRVSKGLHLDCVDPSSGFWKDTFGTAKLNQLAAVLGDKRLHSQIPLKLEKTVREWFNVDQVFNPYSILLDQLRKQIIIDASKSHVWIRKRLQHREFRENHVEAYLIHLVRDGRAVINSFLRKYPNSDMEAMSGKWVTSLKEKKELFNQFPQSRRIQLRYESLASEPQLKIREICAWLEIPFSPDMVEYWKHEHHDISGNGSTYSLIRRYKENSDSAQDNANSPEFYKNLGLTIKIDLRWKTELDQTKLAIFNKIAGEFNRPYEWN